MNLNFFPSPFGILKLLSSKKINHVCPTVVRMLSVFEWASYDGIFGIDILNVYFDLLFFINGLHDLK